MKRVLIVAAAVLLISGTGFAQGITGSGHDFSGIVAWNPGGEICQPCHTPHNAMDPSTYEPLWNHQVTAATFTLYGSSTLDATDLTQPAGASLLCLSCHDGTIALENFGGVTTGTNFITGNALLGTSLAEDHPVSFTYNAALVTLDPGLNATTAASGLGGTIAEDMLFADKMECASCHDVHDAAGEDFLLLKANTASALCLTCHNK